MAEGATKMPDKKTWTDAERLELASKLDDELDDYINSLEKSSYTEGWPEDKWQEEMEKHPFFMKNSPNPEDELSPLLEGLQQLKYSTEENTKEELATNYKEDGNFNYKYKKYRLAIISYTEGIRTKCEDKDLMAQLYNNRAAANFMLENYRSSLSDCKEALKLIPKYPKALNRTANCYFKIKDYTHCIEMCDKILEEVPANKSIIKLKSEAITERKHFERDLRKQKIQQKKHEEQEEKVIKAINIRRITTDLTMRGLSVEMKDLEPPAPQIAQHIVHLDKDERLIWPVIILYPDILQTDYIQNFHEDSTFKEQLEELFAESPPWDTDKKYNVNSVNIYFEGDNKMSMNKIDKQTTLGEIMQDHSFIVYKGSPIFVVLLADSKGEKRVLANYEFK